MPPTPPSPNQPRPARPGAPRRWQTIPALTAVVACGSSGALAFHALYSATVVGFHYDLSAVNWGEYAMACCCALLAATAAAETPTRPPAPTVSALNLPHAPRLAYAALAGLLAAIGFALIGVTRLALPWSLPTFLAWAVLTSLPITALATAVGVLTQHDPDHARHIETTARRRVVPVEGVAVASIGTILLQIPLMGAEHPLIWNTLLALSGPDTTRTLETFAGHLGALAIAAGTALTAATALRTRLIAVPAAALVGGLIQPFGLTTALGLAFVAAIILWWTLRTIRLLITLAPRWRRPHATPATQPLQANGTRLAAQSRPRPETSTLTPHGATVDDRCRR